MLVGIMLAIENYWEQEAKRRAIDDAERRLGIINRKINKAELRANDAESLLKKKDSSKLS